MLFIIFRFPTPFRIPRLHMCIRSACQGYRFENVPHCLCHVIRHTRIKLRCSDVTISHFSPSYEIFPANRLRLRHIHVIMFFYHHHHHHHHHHISVMELGDLFTRSGLTYPEVSSKVCHDFFCQLGNSVSLPWVIYYGAFYLHVVSSFSYLFYIIIYERH